MHRVCPLRSLILAVVLPVAAGCRGAQPQTPLTRAAFDGRTAETLVALDREPQAACDALVWAARGGRASSILAITARGVNPDRCRAGVNGWTPLLHAIHKDQLPAVDALIRAGANVNATAPPAFTPLMMAAGNGNLAIVRRLLRAGADPRITAPNGATALSVAVTGGAFTDIERPLLGACRLEIVRALVDAGASPPEVKPTVRWKVARTIAHLNGCDQAWELAMR